MEATKPAVRFCIDDEPSLSASIAIQSGGDGSRATWNKDPDEIDSGFLLMCLAGERNLDGVREALQSRADDVHFTDGDGRTPLHVAACQGFVDVAELLLQSGAKVDPEDRWGGTPFSDAIQNQKYEMVKLLEKHGAKLNVAPMQVKNAREVPEYEIDPTELDFTNSIQITKGTFRVVKWRGIEVAVKVFGADIMADDKIRAFRKELALLQQVRHPNVIQFLGAVTQSSPMMIVTEYLRKGDLRNFLNSTKRVSSATAVRYALDIARGMTYLHEHKPIPIIHRDLEPSNILMDDAGHLKVADFGISEMLNVARRAPGESPFSSPYATYRYMAPEVFLHGLHDRKSDVFSFSLILQEMIEGRTPFSKVDDTEVPKLYASGARPPFKAAQKHYPFGLKELIQQCWSRDPANRPTFLEIIDRLCYIQKQMIHREARRRRKAKLVGCWHALLFWRESSSASRKNSKRVCGSNL